MSSFFCGAINLRVCKTNGFLISLSIGLGKVINRPKLKFKKSIFFLILIQAQL